MARPREFDVEQALDRATELFWSKGYEATSVQDLVEATGVNRASLYATFGDKADLFAAALEHYESSVNEHLSKALDPPAAGAEAVRAWLAVVIEAATRARGPRGCLLLNTVTGCTTAPAAILDQATTAMRSNRERIERALARDPSLAGRADLPALAGFLAAQGHGLVVLARAGVRRRELESAAEIALRVLAPSPS